MAQVCTPIQDMDNPPTRPMPAFLQRLAAANSKIICTAKGRDVRKLCVAELLVQRLRIPIFQRRYCWCEDQWGTLLSDARLVADGTKSKHPLGRLTCVGNGPNSNGRLVVIDGQQRNTTCTLLLAAIRDLAVARVSFEAAAGTLAKDLDNVLLPDKAGLADWLVNHACGDTLSEGETLEFAALIPTYCDRAAYFAAVLPPCATVTLNAGEWQRPMEAKNFFRKQLENCSVDCLLSLADAVLHKLEWLFFPLNLDGDHADGTEDLHIIYERLAERDSTWCKPTRSMEFASMGAADFVRNLLLGSFEEADAIRMYRERWLPIEQAASAAARRQMHGGAAAAILESMLEAFLAAQTEQSSTTRQQSQVTVGGHLYARFRQWLEAALAADEAALDHVTAKVARVLCRLQDFAVPHLETSNSSMAKASCRQSGNKSSPFPAPIPQMGKKRCPRCSFSNQRSSLVCTACMMLLS